MVAVKKSNLKSRCLAFACLLAIPLILSSCGDDPQQQGAGGYSGSQAGDFVPVPQKTTDVAADAGKLIAADSVVVARINRIGDLIENTKAVAESFQPGAGKFVDLSPLFMMSGLKAEDVDMAGSPVFALNMTEKGPVQSFIVPVKNADAAAGSTRLPSSVSGGYLGLGIGRKPVSGESTPDIARNLPVADCAIRVDLQALVSQFRPMIEPYLDPEALAAMDPSIKKDSAGFAVLGMMGNGTKQLLDDAKQLDIVVSLTGGALEMDFAFKLGGDRSTLSTGRALNLAEMLPMSDASVYMITDFDWTVLMDAFMPMYDKMAEALPEEQGKAFMKLMHSANELYAGMKGPGVFAMSFATDGIQSMGLLENDDPAAYLKRYMSYMDEYSGMVQSLPAEFKVVEFKGGPQKKIDGVDFYTATMRFDWTSAMKANGGLELPPGQSAAMTTITDGILGKDGMSFYQGAHEDLVLMTMGQGENSAASLLGSLKKGQRHKSAVVEHAKARLHAHPSYFFGADLRLLMQQLRPLMKNIAPMPIPEVPAGDPIIVWMSVAVTKHGYRLQSHVDLAGIAELVKAMTRR
jgi:hypothetical protein